MSIRAAVALLILGLTMVIGACGAYVAVAGWPRVRLPISTPATAFGWFGGVAAIVLGLWLVAWVVTAIRRTWINKDHPVRLKRRHPPIAAARRADRVRNTSVRRARARGGQAAPLWGNGGRGAPNNDNTEQLPAVDDDSEALTVTLLPPWRGGGHASQNPSRSTNVDVRSTSGVRPPAERGVATAVRGGAVATIQIPLVRVEEGTHRWAVAAAGPGGSGAATTLVLHSVSSSHLSRVDAPLHADRFACGAAAPALGYGDGRGGSHLDEWTVGDSDATATADLGAITNH